MTNPSDLQELQQALLAFAERVHSFIGWHSPVEVENLLHDAITPLEAEITRLRGHLANIKAHTTPIGTGEDQVLLTASALRRATGELPDEAASCQAEVELEGIKAQMEGMKSILSAARVWRVAVREVGRPNYLSELNHATVVLATVVDANPE